MSHRMKTGCGLKVVHNNDSDSATDDGNKSLKHISDKDNNTDTLDNKQQRRQQRINRKKCGPTKSIANADSIKSIPNTKESNNHKKKVLLKLNR